MPSKAKLMIVSVVTSNLLESYQLGAGNERGGFAPRAAAPWFYGMVALVVFEGTLSTPEESTLVT